MKIYFYSTKKDQFINILPSIIYHYKNKERVLFFNWLYWQIEIDFIKNETY